MAIKSSKTDVIIHACLALEAESVDAAKKIIGTSFPFSQYVEKARFSEAIQVRIFRRDGFVDRYSGQRVFLPAVLNILSDLMPEEFPYQKNWKYSETHQAYSIFCANIDKVVPFASSTDEKNFVTTSYSNKSAKANALLKDIGWRLLSLEEIANERWDGMTGWFINYVQEHKNFLDDSTISKWYRAVQN